MKKIVTMFVMMMMVLAISCAADDATDKDKDTGLKTSSATQLALTLGTLNGVTPTFGADGIATKVPKVATTGTELKGAFVTVAQATYQINSTTYATIDATKVLVATAATPTVEFADALATGAYVVTLTVQKTGEKAKSFEYTFTTTD